MVVVLKNRYKNKKFDTFIMVLYPGRDSVHTHRIKGEKERCKLELERIVFDSLKGNFCKYIGFVYTKRETLDSLEDTENISFLYNVAEWMVEKLEFDGERSMITLAKQIKKIEKRMKSIIGSVEGFDKGPFEFLNIIELCDQVLEGYVNTIFEEE